MRPITYQSLEQLHNDAEELRAHIRANPARSLIDDPDRERIAVRIAENAADIAGGQYRPAYNGWKNRETWNTVLWITNDEGFYDRAREVIAEAVAGSDYDTRSIRQPDDERRYLRSVAGDALKEWWDIVNDTPEPAGPIADAWTYALAWVEWGDVADAVKDESQDWLDLIPSQAARAGRVVR